jgi:hypothetical protein
MTSFLDLLEIAAARGDGLHPKLRALCEGMASDTVTRIDGMIQSGPHPMGFEHVRRSALPQRGPLPASDDEGKTRRIGRSE